jgi:hypothetical protein
MDSNTELPAAAPVPPSPGGPTQATPPAQPTANPVTLTFTLPSVDKDGADHLAVTAFPKSYQVRLLTHAWRLFRRSE